MYGNARTSTKEKYEARQIAMLKKVVVDQKIIPLHKQSGEDFNRKTTVQIVFYSKRS